MRCGETSWPPSRDEGSYRPRKARAKMPTPAEMPLPEPVPGIMMNFQPFLVHHSPASRKRVPLSSESSWAKTT